MAAFPVLDINNFAGYNDIIPYIRYCNEDKYSSPWELKKRRIGDYEFIFITKGDCEFDIEGSCYNVKANDLLLLKPDRFHQGKSASLPFEFLCIHFDLYISRSESQMGLQHHQNGCGWIPKKPIKYAKAVLDFPEHVCTRDASHLLILLKRIVKEMQEKRRGYNLTVKSLFLEFLVAAFRQLDAREKAGIPTRVQPEAVQNIINFIEKNYMKKILLSDLSRHVHLEETYISKMFKKSTGLSFTEYLTLFRLSVAKKNAL